MPLPSVLTFRETDDDQLNAALRGHRVSRCAGTTIDKNAVLAAVHCFRGHGSGASAWPGSL
jgi:hypothetical protein